MATSPFMEIALAQKEQSCRDMFSAVESCSFLISEEQ